MRVFFLPWVAPVVAVAMSGGVDSSVAAYLLRQQGYRRLEGWYMRNWDARDQDGVCPGEQDWADVQRVCAALDMPCRRVRAKNAFWNGRLSQSN